MSDKVRIVWGDGEVLNGYRPFLKTEDLISVTLSSTATLLTLHRDICDDRHRR